MLLKRELTELFQHVCACTVFLNLANDSLRLHLGNWGGGGGGGRLRCLHSKVDTTISCVCTCTVDSAQCSGCMVYGPNRTMAAISLLLMV